MSENVFDAIPIRRSYERDILRPLAALTDSYVQTIGDVQYGSHKYALRAVQNPKVFNANHPTVLISGGVHGEEPAGAYAVSDFLKEEARDFSDRVNMVIFPCVNPSGFEADKRRTMDHIDLNRQFGIGSNQPEIRLIEDYLAQLRKRFLLTIDCHEDGPTSELENEGITAEDVTDGCYLYETMVDHDRRIGRMLINALSPSVDVCMQPTIWGDINDRGIIAYPEASQNPFYAKGTSFDAYCVQHWTDHALTTETCMVWPMEKRIAVHRTWIRTALELILKEQ